MENKKAVKLTDFQKNEENPFMKQAIEGIENPVVKKYKSNSGGDKRAMRKLQEERCIVGCVAWKLGALSVPDFL